MASRPARSDSSPPEPPRGWRRVGWLGPGFLWMVSAAGSGELLFTPRVGAMYGYTLLWAMVAAIALKWIINREIGRYAVCTGRTLLAGFTGLPHGRVALWVILAPQAVVAVAAIAGLAASAATALILVLPGNVRIWTLAAVLASAALVFFGRYRVIERAAMMMGVALAVSAVITAVAVGPRAGALWSGLVPRWSERVEIQEVLPWLGFMLSGAAGLIWYSYWITAKGYGLAGSPEADPRALDAAAIERLRGWIRQMTFDNTVAVVGTFLVAGSFLVLGAELLQPRGLVPEEQRVAATLGRLLGDVWGPTGFWFMISAVFVGFWDTVLSDQDGHARTFADGTRLAVPRARTMSEERLRRGFVAVLVTALPIGLYLVIGEPVTLLKIAGAIEAAHIPVVAALTLVLNARVLPRELRPARVTMIATAGAAMFFAAFAVYYLWSLAAGAGGS
jgi:Mn2+/Fe2+ NRAMP family transporter